MSLKRLREDNSLENNTISELHIKQTKFNIVGRVIHKDESREWGAKTTPGEIGGTYFSFILHDGNSEIRITAFDQFDTKFFPQIQLQKTYLISNGLVKLFRSKLEINLNRQSTIELINKDIALPEPIFNFKNISEFEDEDDTKGLFDVIGICIEHTEVIQMSLEKKKREIILTDQSNKEIMLTLWDNRAQDFVGSIHDVVIVNKVKITTYRQKSLNATNTSSVYINLRIPQVEDLRRWFQTEGQYAERTSLTYNNIIVNNEFVFTFYGKISDFRSDKALEKLCTKCKARLYKSVENDLNCAFCKNSFTQFKYKLELHLEVQDLIFQKEKQWITCSKSITEKILNIQEEELMEMLQNDENIFNEILKNCISNPFMFNIKIKMSSNNAVQVEVIDIVKLDTDVCSCKKNKTKLTE